MDRPFALYIFVIVTTSTALAHAEDAWWGRDKALHFAAGTAISGAGYAVGTALWPERSRSILLGLGSALAIGAIKEGLDATGLGDPSWKDFAWDAIGGVCGIGVAFSIDVGVHGGTAAIRF
jgi:putative lipoprotein